MHFGVLGPLTVRGPAGMIDIGSRRKRALLCWLLLNANEPVSVSSTVSVLWPGPVPTSAPVRVQRMVRELNTVLDAALSERGQALRLHVEPEQLDVARFRALADQADRDLEVGQMDGALAALRAAIALWRGKPYLELDRALPAIGPGDRLTERYLQCLEQRNALLLTGAVDFRLVADLRAASMLHPQRARLHHQLALALYRCGRQVEALATLREILDHEDDRGATARLQAAILRHDPALLAGELPSR